MRTASLGSDHTISRVIRGGWQLAGGHGPVEEDAAIADMIAFADAGITTFDCADIYTGRRGADRRVPGTVSGLARVGCG